MKKFKLFAGYLLALGLAFVLFVVCPSAVSSDDEVEFAFGLILALAVVPAWAYGLFRFIINILAEKDNEGK